MTSGAFLQSEEWGAFQRAVGRDVVRVDGVGQFVMRALPFGMKYAFCPKGPTTEVSVETLRAVAKKLDVMFLRVEPVRPFSFFDRHLYKTSDVSPSHTLITDLTKSEPDLLSAMREKTRYNVRLAARRSVTVSIAKDALDDVWPLFVATAKRGRFRLHPKSYYERMTDPIFLATARVGEEIVAANVMVDYGGTRTYLHGASSDAHRDAMAPYLLHWELMRDAKRLGLTAYDWWGVAPADAGEDHLWAGITRFKLGFGGTRVDYPGTFDVVAMPTAYGLYQWLRRARRSFH